MQKKRMKRDKARANERRECSRSGRRQEEMECRRTIQVTERGRIIKAQTPSGRRQREVAGTAAGVDGGRDAARKLERDKRFEDRMANLPEVVGKTMGKEELKELRRKAVFYRGSREHKVKLPDVDKDKEVKREVWNPVIGEEGTGMRVIDSTEGMKIRGEDVWLVPRRESIGQLEKEEGVGWIYDILSKVARGSGKLRVRQNEGGKRIVALDGEGSKYTILGTQVRLCGRGVVTNMRGVGLLPKSEQKEFATYVKKVEHLICEESGAPGGWTR